MKRENRLTRMLAMFLGLTLLQPVLPVQAEEV